MEMHRFEKCTLYVVHLGPECLTWGSASPMGLIREDSRGAGDPTTGPCFSRCCAAWSKVASVAELLHPQSCWRPECRDERSS